MRKINSSPANKPTFSVFFLFSLNFFFTRLVYISKKRRKVVESLVLEYMYLGTGDEARLLDRNKNNKNKPPTRSFRNVKVTALFASAFVNSSFYTSS